MEEEAMEVYPEWESGDISDVFPNPAATAEELDNLFDNPQALIPFMKLIKPGEFFTSVADREVWKVIRLKGWLTLYPEIRSLLKQHCVDSSNFDEEERIFFRRNGSRLNERNKKRLIKSNTSVVNIPRKNFTGIAKVRRRNYAGVGIVRLGKKNEKMEGVSVPRRAETAEELEILFKDPEALIPFIKVTRTVDFFTTVAEREVWKTIRLKGWMARYPQVRYLLNQHCIDKNNYEEEEKNFFRRNGSRLNEQIKRRVRNNQNMDESKEIEDIPTVQRKIGMIAIPQKYKTSSSGSGGQVDVSTQTCSGSIGRSLQAILQELQYLRERVDLVADSVGIKSNNKVKKERRFTKFVGIESLPEYDTEAKNESPILYNAMESYPNPTKFLLSLADYEIWQTITAAEFLSFTNLVDMMVEVYSNGTGSGRQELTTQLRSFFYRAKDRVRTRHKRRFQRASQGENKQSNEEEIDRMNPTVKIEQVEEEAEYRDIEFPVNWRDGREAGGEEGAVEEEEEGAAVSYHEAPAPYSDGDEMSESETEEIAEDSLQVTASVGDEFSDREEDELENDVQDDSETEDVEDDRPLSSQPFFCQECGEVFPGLAGLTRHKRTHLCGTGAVEEAGTADGGPTVSCSLCGVSLPSLASLTAHLADSHSASLDCDLCQQEFSLEADLRLHRASHHPPTQGQHEGESQHVCNICGSGFDQRVELSRHLKSHT